METGSAKVAGFVISRAGRGSFLENISRCYDCTLIWGDVNTAHLTEVARAIKLYVEVNRGHNMLHQVAQTFMNTGGERWFINPKESKL